MFAGLYLLIRKWPWKFFTRQWWIFALKGMGILLLISVAGYFLSLLTWPYALENPATHSLNLIAGPKKAFEVMSDIQVSIRVLYEGNVTWSDTLPGHYIPRNILLTVPALILVGLFVSPITWFLDRKKGHGYWYFLLWFTILFPIIFIIIRESNVYGGWRHMMFVFPSIIALSALSLTSLIRRVPAGWIRVTVCVLLAAGLLHPFRHIIVNHPNTYIYYNELSGGINKTYGKYETDYYTNSLRPASDYFLEEILPDLDRPAGDPVKVVSNAWIPYYFHLGLCQEAVPPGIVCFVVIGKDFQQSFQDPADLIEPGYGRVAGGQLQVGYGIGLVIFDGAFQVIQCILHFRAVPFSNSFL